MDKNKSKNVSGEQSMDSVHLVATLLMCFPELGKVTLDSEEEGMWLEFTMKDMPEESRREKAEKQIADSLKLFHEIEGNDDVRLAFYCEARCIRIFRDIESVSRTEIGMLVTLMRDNFEDLLLADTMNCLDEEAVINQSEMIDHRIFCLREHAIPEKRVGVREEGRVMVY